jgi:hypothetical protein
MGAMGKETSVSLIFYDAEAKNYVHSEVSSLGETFISHGTVNGDTWVFETDTPMMGKPMHSKSTVHSAPFRCFVMHRPTMHSAPAWHAPSAGR